MHGHHVCSIALCGPLDQAFLFERSIDIDTYHRHRDKLREEHTLVRIDRHSGPLDELDVEGILPFAERVLPRAGDLWVQASREQRQRFHQLSSARMPLCECHAGAGLQVFLEFCRGLLIGAFHNDVYFPWFASRRVRAMPSIVAR
jgi:hypothetical protein